MKINEPQIIQQYECEETRSQDITIKVIKNGKGIYIHSRYDPVKEGKQYAIGNVDEETRTYLLFGFGLGYHVREILKLLSSDSTLTIIESNLSLFKKALELLDLTDILSDYRLTLILENRYRMIAKRISMELNIDEKTKLLLHMPSVQALPESCEELQQLLEEYKVHQNSMESHFVQLMHENFDYNISRNHVSADILFEQFVNIPAILVAAGPSLDRNKHLLLECKDRTLIVSVGRAVKALLEVDVVPDLIVVSDSGEDTHLQIADIGVEIPVIVLSTCDRNVFAKYIGPKLIAFQKGFAKAEQYAAENLHKLVDTGGSVATTTLDLLIRFGCDPIIFVGQDLAYTNNRSHTEGTSFQELSEKDTRRLRKVKGYHGDSVYTLKNLSIYKRWIENRIRREQDRLFIDATEGGAYIEGTKRKTLKAVIEKDLSGEQTEAISQRISELLKGLVR